MKKNISWDEVLCIETSYTILYLGGNIYRVLVLWVYVYVLGLRCNYHQILLVLVCYCSVLSYLLDTTLWIWLLTPCMKIRCKVTKTFAVITEEFTSLSIFHGSRSQRCHGKCLSYQKTFLIICCLLFQSISNICVTDINYLSFYFFLRIFRLVH